MLQQIYTANQLRQIHEDRIAPFINQGNEVEKPKKKNSKTRSWTFNLFNPGKKVTQS